MNIIHRLMDLDDIGGFGLFCFVPALGCSIPALFGHADFGWMAALFAVVGIGGTAWLK